MKNKLLIVVLINVWGMFILSASAQENCQDALLMANEAFDNGKYAEVVSLLHNKVQQCNYSKESYLQALKLLAAANVELDEIEQGQELIVNFLQKNPTYTLQSIDPQAFITLFNNYDVNPRFSFGLNAGLQQSLLQIHKEYPIWKNSNYLSTYSAPNNYTIGLNLGWHALSRLSLNTELNISQLSYDHQLVYDEGYSLSFSEKLLQTKASLYASVQLFHVKNISFNVLAGMYGYRYSNFNQNYSSAYQSISLASSESTSLSRNAMGYGFMSGLKFSHQRNQFTFSLQPRYYYAKSLVNNSENRYSNSSFNTSQLYVDDNFSINQMEVVVGVAYTFSYKIKHKYYKNKKAPLFNINK